MRSRKIYVYVFLICEGENSAVNGNELSMSLKRAISHTFFYVCFMLSYVDAVHLCLNLHCMMFMGIVCISTNL